jgi:phage tail-like protein
VSRQARSGSPNWLVDQLPVGMLEDDFLVRFTSIFQDVADTLVDSVDTIDATTDLTVTPDPFVRWLGSWIDAYPNPGETAQAPGGTRERAWIQAQARTLTGRGTRPSLELMLQELCGGQPVRVIDGGGVYPVGQCPTGDPAWVQVELPRLDQVAASDVLDLIRTEVPVQVAVHLVVDGAVVDQVGHAVPKHRAGDTEPEVIGSDLSRSVRRLPGTAGRADQPFRSCRVCAERNQPDEADCWRCGSALERPARTAEPQPEPAAIQLSPEPEWDEPRIWPVVVLIVAILLVLAALGAGAALL